MGGRALTTANPVPDQVRVFHRLTVDVHFTPIVQRRVLVEWALERTFLEPGPYTFTLYRCPSATSPEAEWTAIAEVVDQPWAYDNNPALPAKGTDIFYRVVLVDGLGAVHTSQAVTGSSYWNRYDFTLAREIIRKETMLLRKRAGIKGWLLRRRTFGDPCPCTDPETEQVLNPNCEECFGTGYVGGYFPAFEYWVIANPSQHMRKLDADRGLITENVETVRALAYPSPASGDVWVNAYTDQRYLIMSNVVSLAKHRGIDLILQLQLQERTRGEAIYQIPVGC